MESSSTMYIARHKYQEGFALGEELLEEKIQSRAGWFEAFALSVNMTQASYPWSVSVQADTNYHVEKSQQASSFFFFFFTSITHSHLFGMMRPWSEDLKT